MHLQGLQFYGSKPPCREVPSQKIPSNPYVHLKRDGITFSYFQFSRDSKSSNYASAMPVVLWFDSLQNHPFSAVPNFTFTIFLQRAAFSSPNCQCHFIRIMLSYHLRFPMPNPSLCMYLRTSCPIIMWFLWNKVSVGSAQKLLRIACS